MATNYIEIFNETCIILCIYHMIIFSDVYDNMKMKYDLGWSMVALALL